MERRTFLRSAVLTAASYTRILGANETVRVGLIGAGGQGLRDLSQFLTFPDAAAVAVADVNAADLEGIVAFTGGRAEGWKDFRRILDRQDIDAVIVATPAHRHALPVIAACAAGKDVYCETPLSVTVGEGRRMLDAARRHSRVVQTGGQQRSGEHYRQAARLIRSGRLGKIHQISATMLRGAGLDWDSWLGPAPGHPCNQPHTRCGFRKQSGSSLTRFGAPQLDIARWAMNLQAPLGVAGFCAPKGEREELAVEEVVYQFPDCVITWSVRETNAGPLPTLEFHGTQATLVIDRRGFQITRTGRRAQLTVAGDREMHRRHVRNFLDCVKSRKRPNADVEDGHLTAAMCHLGNIATRLGRSLKWDAARERISGDSEANAWLARPYRAPWKPG